jgi:hypothetical protein
MAEMFDILQNTKHKREVKAQQTNVYANSISTTPHSHAHTTTPHHEPTPKEKKQTVGDSKGKTIFIGIVVTVIGFALGQLFQHRKMSESTPQVTATPTMITPTQKNIESSTPADRPPHSVVTLDRSNDKMTIRAQVAGSNLPAPTPEHGKDLQELKDLKKELLELKALKEEIRGNDDTGHNTTNPNAITNDSDSSLIEGPNDEDRNNQDSPNGNEVHY